MAAYTRPSRPCQPCPCRPRSLRATASQDSTGAARRDRCPDGPGHRPAGRSAGPDLALARQPQPSARRAAGTRGTPDRGAVGLGRAVLGLRPGAARTAPAACRRNRIAARPWPVGDHPAGGTAAGAPARPRRPAPATALPPAWPRTPAHQRVPGRLRRQGQLGLDPHPRAHGRTRCQRPAAAPGRHRARHHRRAPCRRRAPHRQRGAAQHERGGGHPRPRPALRRRQPGLQPDHRLQRRRSAGAAVLHARQRRPQRHPAPRPGPPALAGQRVDDPPRRRGHPLPCPPQRHRRRRRRGQFPRGGAQRHHRAEARRAGAALPGQLRHPDQPAQPLAAVRAPGPGDRAGAARGRPRGGAVPGPGPFQGRQRLAGPCHRRPRPARGGRAGAAGGGPGAYGGAPGG